MRVNSSNRNGVFFLKTQDWKEMHNMVGQLNTRKVGKLKKSMYIYNLHETLQFHNVRENILKIKHFVSCRSKYSASSESPDCWPEKHWFNLLDIHLSKWWYSWLGWWSTYSNGWLCGLGCWFWKCKEDVVYLTHCSRYIKIFCTHYIKTIFWQFCFLSTIPKVISSSVPNEYMNQIFFL